MTVKIRKKNSRCRGNWTHGWGHKKKHRGAGSRGGKGLAGTGKRGDVKKPSFWKEKYFGRVGFTPKNTSPVYSINVSNLNQEALNLATKEKDMYVFDLTKLGFDKLLGSGIVDKPLKVTVRFATDSAIKKIEAAKGQVIVLSANTENNDSAEAEE